MGLSPIPNIGLTFILKGKGSDVSATEYRAMLNLRYQSLEVLRS